MRCNRRSGHGIGSMKSVIFLQTIKDKRDRERYDFKRGSLSERKWRPGDR